MYGGVIISFDNNHRNTHGENQRFLCSIYSQISDSYARSVLSDSYARSILKSAILMRGGGLGSRPQKMYGERLGDGVEYHSMKPTPRR